MRDFLTRYVVVPVSAGVWLAWEIVRPRWAKLKRRLSNWYNKGK